MSLLKQRTKNQIQAEIDLTKTKLDSIEEHLHVEPWNFALRQQFRDTQAMLNSLLSEIASL